MLPETETRNVIDHYHYWTNDAIIADLRERSHNFDVMCCNIGNDFNIATVIRNANAFLAGNVIVYGNKKYDRRGTVGTHLYTRFKHVKVLEDFESLLKETEYYVIGIDNVPGAEQIETFEWPKDKRVLLIFGQEQIGIPSEILTKCHKVLYISQYGSVRSLNVGTASGIAMYSYTSKTCLITTTNV